jgi:cell division protein FtsN
MSSTSQRRKKRRARSAGGTLLGILVGLLVGLAVAVAAALYMTRSSLPFVDKVKRPPERPVDAAKAPGELPDPNRSGPRSRPPADGTAAAPGAPPAAAVPGPAPGAPPVAAAPPSAPPASGGDAAPDRPSDRSTYLLQAGAFKGQEDAESMKAKLALVGFEARIVTAEVNGVTFYRVRVGPYGQIDDMNRARSRLAENGIEASVVRQR